MKPKFLTDIIIESKDHRISELEQRIAQLEEALRQLLNTCDKNKHQLWLNDPEWESIEKAKSLLK